MKLVDPLLTKSCSTCYYKKRLNYMPCAKCDSSLNEHQSVTTNQNSIIMDDKLELLKKCN